MKLTSRAKWGERGRTALVSVVERTSPREVHVYRPHVSCLLPCAPSTPQVKNFEADLRGVLESFFANINETIKKPLTHCSPEEEKRIKSILAIKEEYKLIRTQYSVRIESRDRVSCAG